jgi:hypothetical protein
MENTLKAQSPLQPNLLDILAVNNVYSLHALKFIHLWHKGLLPNLFNTFFNTQAIFTITILDMRLNKICINHV